MPGHNSVCQFRLTAGRGKPSENFWKTRYKRVEYILWLIH